MIILDLPQVERLLFNIMVNLFKNKKLLNEVFLSHLSNFQELYYKAIKENKKFIEWNNRKFSINYSKNLLDYFKSKYRLPNLTKH